MLSRLLTLLAVIVLLGLMCSLLFAYKQSLHRQNAILVPDAPRDFRTTMEGPTAGGIPKVIHQTWKTRELPPWGVESVESWKTLNPGWKHKLYDDDDMDDVVRTHFPDLWPHYLKMKPVQKADVFRYAVVWAFGGVYSDIDVRCIVPAAQWGGAGASTPSLVGIDFIVGFEALPRRSDWKKWYASQFQMCQWTFAAARHHWLLKSVLDEIEAYYTEGAHLRSKSIIKSTGPGIWSKGIQSAILRRYNITFGADPLTRARLKDHGARIDRLLVLPLHAFGSGSGGKYAANDQVRLIQHNFMGTWKK